MVDVLEEIDLRAKQPYAARRELSMQEGELFADPSVVVNDRVLHAGDGRTPGTFRVSRGARGVRFDWKQPRGPAARSGSPTGSRCWARRTRTSST